MSQSYQMLWNCGACGTKGLLGLTHRCCPNCGSPQDPKKRYFPEEGQEVLAENHQYAGADKICPFCSVAQSAKATFCGGCGGALDGSKTVEKISDAAATPPAAKAQLPGQTPHPGSGKPPSKPANVWPRRLAAGSGVTLLVLISLVLCEKYWTKAITLTVKGHSWSREIEVETFRTQRAGAWCSALPGDAYSVSKSRKQSGTEEVANGQSCHTVRNDNGDGTFSKSEECSTNYKSVATYDNWCDYKVDRWIVTETLKSQGQSKASKPSWPSTEKIRGGSTLGSERAGAKRETYLVHFAGDHKTKERPLALDCGYPQSQWEATTVAAQVTGEQGVLLGTITCESLKQKPVLAH